MFAILFTDKMDGFYAIITSFPTVIFTVLLLVSLFYWLITFVGIVDFDVLDLGDGDVGDLGDASAGNGVAGLAMRLGLNGVPLAIVISLISAFGWFISYYCVYFASRILPSPLLYIAGIGIFIFSLYMAIVITAQVIKPLRRLFKKADQYIEKTIVGKVAIVRTGRADNNFGEATVADGGAGLIVKVRSYKDEEFKRGDRVVLLEYDISKGIYKVIHESEFNG